MSGRTAKCFATILGLVTLMLFASTDAIAAIQAVDEKNGFQQWKLGSLRPKSFPPGSRVSRLFGNVISHDYAMREITDIERVELPKSTVGGYPVVVSLEYFENRLMYITVYSLNGGSQSAMYDAFKKLYGDGELKSVNGYNMTFWKGARSGICKTSESFVFFDIPRERLVLQHKVDSDAKRRFEAERREREEQMRIERDTLNDL